MTNAIPETIWLEFDPNLHQWCEGKPHDPGCYQFVAASVIPAKPLTAERWEALEALVKLVAMIAEHCSEYDIETLYDTYGEDYAQTVETLRTYIAAPQNPDTLGTPVKYTDGSLSREIEEWPDNTEALEAIDWLEKRYKMIEEPKGAIEHTIEALHQIRTALTCKAPAIPEDWKLVPVEPTEAMVTGVMDDMAPNRNSTLNAAMWLSISRAYRLMLSASPPPPAASKDEGV